MTSRFKFVVVTSSTFLVILLLFGTVMGRSAPPASEDAYRHLAVFTEVLSRIKSDYVEEPDMKNVTLGALNGLLESVDPFASYLNADQYKQHLRNKDGKRAGVGLILSKKFGYVGVVDAIPGSPAAKAGLNTGDMLESIGGVATRDMPLAYAEMLLYGEPGTNVDLSVLRVRNPEPQKISLTRAAVKNPPLASKMLPEQIGYVQVQSLEAGKVKEIGAAIESLQKQGAKRLILDLRNSALGGPEEGAGLANLFVEKGTLTYSQGQKTPRQNFDAVPGRVISKLPLVVITNRGTASGAEVAAGALLDSKRAEVVGERTYGDAATRKAITMEDGSAVILSVAKFYSPSGKALQDTGVTPSVAVVESDGPSDQDDDDAQPPQQPQAQPDQPKKPGEDVLLKKAIEVAVKGAPAAAADANGARKDAAEPGQNLGPLGVPRNNNKQ